MVGTIKWKPASQKETSPLAHSVRNSLPHKSHRFCSPMRKMEPSNWSHQIRKKKLPLLLTSFAIHCLTKATAFVPQCENNGAIKMEPSNKQKETSPLAHSVRNSLPHKSHCFCSPMRKMEPSKWSHQIRKKKLPLLLTLFAIHCLTKATAFVPQCENNGTIKMEPSNTQKETSPLAHSVRNSLPHKSHRFCSPML